MAGNSKTGGWKVSNTSDFQCGIDSLARMERWRQADCLCADALKFSQRYPTSKQATGLLEHALELSAQAEENVLVPEFWDVYQELRRGD